ncbi:MAG: hypothetical protein BRD49_01220 [Bacteroidetes bacterium SW_10_40_5]|nr:MAG: hypothetical protein BRD49_01220 [Bacteroidetes bacterium SW_10_40_5]
MATEENRNKPHYSDQQELERNKRIRRQSAISTAVIFIGIFIVFFMVGLRTPLPLPEEKGVNVVLGEHDVGRNKIQKETGQKTEKTEDQKEQQTQSEEVEESEQQTKEPSASQTEVEEPTPQQSETQDQEEAPQIDKQKPQETQQEETEKSQKQQKEKESEEKREVDPETLYPEESGSSQGEEDKEGNKGNKEGQEDADQYDKNQGESAQESKGVTFSLKGRHITQFPSIDDESQKTGKIVLKIVVNQEGNVIEVSGPARGSTITDLSLMKLAKKAAKDTEFSPNPKGPQEQVGSMTFKFKVQ